MAEPDLTKAGAPEGASPGVGTFLRRHWHLLLLGLLIAAHLAINWAWLSTNVVILGWDRPRHLIESLVYNDILEQVTLRSLFEAWTHSGYYPPLYHLAMVASYKLFGVSMDVAVSVNMVFLALLLIAAYGIGSRMGGRGAGLLSAFVTSSLPMIFGMSRYTYIEFALTSMVAVSFWLLLLSEGFRHKRYSLLLGACAGVGLLTKWTYVLFVLPALAMVVWRAGVLTRARTGLRSLRLDWRWAGVSAGAGAALTLVWYLPNLDRVGQLPVGHLLLPIAWLFLTGLIYVAKQPGSLGWNLAGSLWLCLVVAGSWYLPRIDFVNHTFLIAWGRPERQKWAFGYYLDYLIREELSPIYMVLLLLVSVALLLLAWRSLRQGNMLRRTLRSDFLLLFLWIVVPYLVLSFRPSSRHSRFIMPILPALAVLIAYGIYRLRWAKLRLAAVALVVLLGGAQWLTLSFDSLAWLREAAAAGPVNLFAHRFQNQLPSSGDTDRRYWVVPDILKYISDQAEIRGRPLELAMLVNTRQVHDEHFLYLIYTDFPNVRLRELAQNWTGRPAYPQLFEVDYVAVPSANPDHRLDPESLEVVEMLLQGPPTLFQEAFRLAREYPLPDGDIIYVYEKTLELSEGYEAEPYEALGEDLQVQLGDGGVLLLHSQHQVPLLGRYYVGRPDLVVLPEMEGGDKSSVVQMVREAVAGHQRVATVFEAGQGEEMQSIVGQWLSENLFQALDSWYGPARVTLYDSGSAVSDRGSNRSVEAEFGGEITLLEHSPLPQSMVAGEILPLTLVWQASGIVQHDYNVFLHLIDAEGNLAAQRDSKPVGGWRPTTSWALGEEIRDNHGVLTTSSLPAGEYELVLGLYDDHGQRLPVLDEDGQTVGDKMSLGTVKVLAPCFCAGREETTETVKYDDSDEE
ncbi:MAG TPA: glycosyltransferase family 39 protein [Anaerolineae bacterium]|nr:glycosyltransferase family 39 protein [Anaerolineae bacterium]